jgi:hypothetical protein
MHIYMLEAGTGAMPPVVYEKAPWQVKPEARVEFFFWDSVSLYSQAGLKLTTLLPQPPKGWDYRNIPLLALKHLWTF